MATLKDVKNKIKVYLLAGQSNMNGMGDLTGARVAEAAGPQRDAAPLSLRQVGQNDSFQQGRNVERLARQRQLAGGGHFKIINQQVPQALAVLGYSDDEIVDIVAYAVGHGSLADAPGVRPFSWRS